MELMVVADSLFYKTPDNKYWCKTIYGYSFWERYLEIFETLAVVSRTKNVSYEEVEGFLRVDGTNLRIIELPYMRGMINYIKNIKDFRNESRKAIENADYALFRLPSVVAFMVLKFYKKKRKPYVLEVVVDPYDAYSENKLAQYIYTKKLKKATMKANGVSYVTKEFLQNRYPSFARLNGESNSYFETHYSTINLLPSFFYRERIFNNDKKEYVIVHTANNINNNVKGHAIVIEVVKNLRELGYNVSAKFIGDGIKKDFYKNLAIEKGIDDFVTFTGMLSSSYDVRKELINSDIFLFPTKAEGLPRAVIEAMAVGLPCLSTPVNGIPELLDNKFMCDPEDVEGFTLKIIDLISNPNKMKEASEENLIKAEQYTHEKLRERRNAFYKKLKRL